MSTTRFHLAVSLDGYAAGPDLGSYHEEDAELSIPPAASWRSLDS